MRKHHIAHSALGGAAALLLATAPAAWADLQAQTIWADWQDVYNRLGGTLGATSTDYSNGVLTLEGVNYSTDITGTTSVDTYGTIVMEEQDDGTVIVRIPSEMRSESTTTTDGAEVEQIITLRHDDLSIVAREEEGERVYDITAQSITMDVDTILEARGETTAPNRVTLRMDGLESAYRSGLGADGTQFEQTYDIDRMAFGSNLPQDGGQVDISYALTDLVSAFEGRYGEAPTGPFAGLSNLNITYDGTITHSGSIMSIAGPTPNGPVDIAGTSDGGTLALDLGDRTLGYAVTSTGGKITAQVPGFPLPVTLSMEEIGTAFTLPTGEPGPEAPFAMTFTLRDLTVDDMLWGMFDPTGQLPRDPATVVLDVEGTAVMNVDLFGDPEVTAALSGPPGELKGLTLNRLRVAFAGADLSGSGDLDFPTAATPPEPVGTIDLALNGGFALVDRLVVLGVVSVQQAAFVKGMAGAVAQSVGEDQLESTIEFTPGGGISANGLPLR